MGKKILVVSLWVFCLFNPTKLSAEEKVGLVPAHPNIADKESFTRFQFELRPGEKKRDELAVVNLTTERQEVRFRVVGVDASWVKIASEAGVLVKVAERKWVSFEVEVPQEVKPGEHYIHIVGDSGGDLEIRVTVIGELRREIVVEKLEVELMGGKPIVEMTVKNSGNTRLSSLGLRLVFRNSIQLGALKEKEIFLAYDKKIEPGERVVARWQTEERLPMLGRFTPSYSVAFVGGQVTGGKQAFVYVNWFRLVGSVSVVVGVGFGVVKVAKKVLYRKRVVEIKKINLTETEPTMGEKTVDWVVGRLDEETKNKLLLDIRRIVREELFLNGQEQPKKRRNRVYTLR